MSAAKLAIKMQDLKKVYDTGAIRVEALSGIDLEIERGQFVSIAVGV